MRYDSNSWRYAIMSVIDIINSQHGGNLCQIIPIEFSERYEGGETDVYPPNFRIQITFSSLEAKKIFIAKILELKLNREIRNKLLERLNPDLRGQILDLRVTDDRQS